MAADDKVAHLGMLQSVISRLSTNSFLVKGWSITLVSALFALAAADTDRHFVALAYFPAFAFWALDAYFLRQEKLFRRLYDEVRLASGPSDFSMDAARFEKEVRPAILVAFSGTLLLFHGTIALATLVVMFTLRVGNG